MRSSWCAALAALFTLLAAADLGAQGIAAVSQCSGSVQVVDAATRTPRTVAVLPDTGRVSGGTLAAGDEVVTGPGGTAEVRFPDGSVLRLEAGTRLAVGETALPAGRPGEKSVRRTLTLNSGRVACDIHPSETVYTSIRSPAGSVGIRGTTLTVAFADGRFQVAVGVGQVFVFDPPLTSVFSLGNGQAMELQADAAGGVVAKATAAGGRSVSASIGDARVQLNDGDAIRVASGADGTIAVTVVSGPVQVSRGGAAAVSMAAGTGFTVASGPEPGARPASAAAPAGPAAAEVPPLPVVPVIQSTVEASPMD